MVALFDQLARVRIEYATAFIGLLFGFPAILEAFGVDVGLNGTTQVYIIAGATIVSVSVLATKIEKAAEVIASAKRDETDYRRERYVNGGQR